MNWGMSGQINRWMDWVSVLQQTGHFRGTNTFLGWNLYGKAALIEVKCWCIVALQEVRGQRFGIWFVTRSGQEASTRNDYCGWQLSPLWTHCCYHPSIHPCIDSFSFFFFSHPALHPAIHPSYFVVQWWIERQQSFSNNPAVCGNVLMNNGAENNVAAEWRCSRSRLDNEWSHIRGQVPSTGSWRDCNSWPIISQRHSGFTVSADKAQRGFTLL